jgi:hypothetical protein
MVRIFIYRYFQRSKLLDTKHEMTTGSGNVNFFLFIGTVNLATFLNQKKHETTTGSGNDVLKFSLLLNYLDLSFKNPDPH